MSAWLTEAPDYSVATGRVRIYCICSSSAGPVSGHRLFLHVSSALRTATRRNSCSHSNLCPHLKKVFRQEPIKWVLLSFIWNIDQSTQLPQRRGLLNVITFVAVKDNCNFKENYCNVMLAERVRWVIWKNKEGAVQNHARTILPFNKGQSGLMFGRSLRPRRFPCYEWLERAFWPRSFDRYSDLIAWKHKKLSLVRFMTGNLLRSKSEDLSWEVIISPNSDVQKSEDIWDIYDKWLWPLWSGWWSCVVKGEH